MGVGGGGGGGGYEATGRINHREQREDSRETLLASDSKRGSLTKRQGCTPICPISR